METKAKKISFLIPCYNEEENVELKGLTHIQRVNVTDQIQLTANDQIKALFKMTPYYWKTPRSGAERLASLDTLTTELHFDFLVYRRAHA